MARTLPIIDISPWILEAPSTSLSSDQLRVSREWDEAMREFGFAIIIGHGIDEIHFNQLLTEGKTFFEQPLAQKMIYNHGDYGHPSGGYTPPGYETVGLSMNEEEGETTKNLDATTSKSAQKSAKFDPVENFVFTATPGSFVLRTGENATPFSSAEEYFKSMEKLLHSLHQLSATALHLPDLNFFNSFYWPETAEMGRNGNCLRVTHYPGTEHRIFSEVRNPSGNRLETEKGGGFDDKVRYGAHTDYQGFTILKPDKNDWHETQLTSDSGESLAVKFGGLEVFLTEENTWIPVRIPKDLNALVVNAGDLFQRWTNDHWHSALHRVVHSSVYREDDSLLGEATVADHVCRYSLVFFTGPLAESVIESIEGINDAESAPRYPPIKSHDHLLFKLNRTNKR